MTRTEVIRELIRLGEESHAYWEKELRKRHPRYPIVQPGEDSGPQPPVDDQIQRLLKSLSETDLYIVLTLMYLGRGDFDLEHLKSGFLTMKESFPSRDAVMDQLLRKQVLSEYLADAMEEIRQGCIDVDSANFEARLAS